MTTRNTALTPAAPSRDVDTSLASVVVSRRGWLLGQLRLGGGLLGGGLLAVGGLSGCAVEGELDGQPEVGANAPGAFAGGLETRGANALANTDIPTPVLVAAPEAEPLFAPYRFGDSLDEKIQLVGAERWPDGHLRVLLRDIVHGGPVEIELFRAADSSRPIAATARWELYSYNGGRGDVATPAHVADFISQLALIVAANEELPAARALHNEVCSFVDRKRGPG